MSSTKFLFQKNWSILNLLIIWLIGELTGGVLFTQNGNGVEFHGQILPRFFRILWNPVTKMKLVTGSTKFIFHIRHQRGHFPSVWLIGRVTGFIARRVANVSSMDSSRFFRILLESGNQNEAGDLFHKVHFSDLSLRSLFFWVFFVCFFFSWMIHPLRETVSRFFYTEEDVTWQTDKISLCKHCRGFFGDSINKSKGFKGLFQYS